jgi:hypothetical protein
MKAYLLTTGAVFGLLTLVHLWRVVEEPHLARQPWYLLITVAAAATRSARDDRVVTQGAT